MTKEQSSELKFDHSSEEVKKLRKSVLKNKNKPSKKVISGVLLYSNGKIKFIGSAKGFLYTKNNGEDNFVLK